MRDNEQKAGSVADQKNKIRERYKGVSIDELDVIPALPQEDIFAVENGYISITPVHINMTETNRINELKALGIEQ